jgi:hypothetical protein
VTTDGVSQDSDGYTVTIQKADYGRSAATVDTVGINGTVTFAAIDTGVYSVTLTDVRFTCTVTSADPPLADLIRLNVTVAANHPAVVKMHFTCRPPPTGSETRPGTGRARRSAGSRRFHPNAWCTAGEEAAGPDEYQAARMWDRNRDRDIFLMNADGSGITMLTRYTGVTPAWSPDGSRIVYRKDPGDPYFISVDGTQEGRFINGWDPDWRR